MSNGIRRADGPVVQPPVTARQDAPPAPTGGAPSPSPAPTGWTPPAASSRAPAGAAPQPPASPSSPSQPGHFSAADRQRLVGELGRANIPADVKQRITNRLSGLGDTPAAAQEAALVRAAMAGHNADRALVAYDEINRVAGSSPQAQARLTPEIREALVRGVADRRTSDVNGQAGLLGVAQARRAAEAVATMPEAQYRALGTALSETGRGAHPSPQADARAEQALILKAVGARAEQLRASPTDEAAKRRGQIAQTQAERAMAEVTGFAADVRGLDRPTLVRTTTPVDLDAATSTSNRDPNALTSTADTRGNNDGLYQRFESTCGPTTAQLARGEADPVFARRLHTDAADASSTSATAREQRATLEKPRFYNSAGNEVQLTAQQASAYRTSGTLPTGITVEQGSTTLRLADQSRTQASGWASGLPAQQRTALDAYLAGATLTPAQLRNANAALTTLRGAHGGEPSQASVAMMRSNPPRSENGMRLPGALNDITRQATGITYQANGVGWTPGTGWSAPSTANFDAMAQRLGQGQSVPVRVGNTSGNGGGHFMLVSDVRGSGADRSFLVSDPYSGRTAWVSQRDMADTSKSWINTHFNMSWQQMTHFYTE